MSILTNNVHLSAHQIYRYHQFKNIFNTEIDINKFKHYIELESNVTTFNNKFRTQIRNLIYYHLFLTRPTLPDIQSELCDYEDFKEIEDEDILVAFPELYPSLELSSDNNFDIYYESPELIYHELSKHITDVNLKRVMSKMTKDKATRHTNMLSAFHPMYAALQHHNENVLDELCRASNTRSSSLQQRLSPFYQADDSIEIQDVFNHLTAHLTFLEHHDYDTTEYVEYIFSLDDEKLMKVFENETYALILLNVIEPIENLSFDEIISRVEFDHNVDKHSNEYAYYTEIVEFTSNAIRILKNSRKN